MPRVIVVHELQKRDLATGEMASIHDFSSAAEFGEIETLVYGDVNGRYDEALDVIREKLLDYTEDDYLLFAGDPALIAMAAAHAVLATGGPVSWLIWDRRQRRYLPHPPLDFYPEEGDEDGNR